MWIDFLPILMNKDLLDIVGLSIIEREQVVCGFLSSVLWKDERNP